MLRPPRNLGSGKTLQIVGMGNVPITTCNKVLGCDFGGVSEVFCHASRSIRYNEEDVQLALRVVYAPMEDASAEFLKMGQEVLIAGIKKVQGWDPLTWRQERVARQQVTGQTSQLWPSLSESRFGRAHRAWSVEILASDGRGGVRNLPGLLQVAHARKDRELDKVKGAVQEISTVANARRFNHHVAELAGEDLDVPAIRVATTVACFVLDGVNPEIADAGDTLLLTLFDAKNLTKFVFEGAEDFLELPQAFFHFVLWSSGGKELVADLQGIQQERDLLLVDPVLLTTGDLDISELLSLATSTGTGSDFQTCNRKRFNLWHPRCAQLCQSFDPQRRGGNTRRACGVPLPNCGVGGG